MAYSTVRNGFNVTTSSAIDKRIYLTIEQMKTAHDDYNLPDKYFCICADNGQIYLYNSENPVETSKAGKYRALDIQLGTAEDGQILMYKNGEWKKVDLADTNSLVYITDEGLQIKGYNFASQGQMIVKDVNQGISWINPISTAQLDAAVATATQKAAEASNKASLASTYAVEAQSAASSAQTSATNAETINRTTMEWVNNKFWWGTLEEYNKLPAISDGTFYFIITE